MKTYKPTSDGQRSRISADFDEITRSKPEKSLLAPMKQKAGRNNTGRITIRRRGGGHRRRYRIIDFKRDKFDIPGKVMTVEYDPNRSCYIMLVKFDDNSHAYYLAPQKIKVGDIVENGSKKEIKVGKWPYQIAYNKRKQSIYVTNQRDNSISVIDLKSKKDIKTFDDFCEYPEGIDISYSENLIVVACWFEDNIILMDLNNEKVLKKIGVSGGPRSFGNFILN